MKNKCFKISFFFLSLILFLYTIDANDGELNCGNGSNSVTVIKDGIYSADFSATLPVCNFVKTSNVEKMDGDYNTRQVAFDSGYDLEYRKVESYDAKSLVGKSFPRCSDDERTVNAKVVCEKEVNSYYFNCSSLEGDLINQCGVGNRCKKTGNKCEGSYYYCSNDLTLSDDRKKCFNSTSFEVKNVTDDLSTSNNEEFKKMVDSGYDCAVTYNLVCPVYKCEKIYDTIDACNLKFSINGSRAYCINPSQGFNAGNNNYQVDESFNIFNCSNSYSTVDCGYANILIEGAYYNTPDTSIDLALRLWGYHSGQRGYDKTGIANLTGSSCKDITYFMGDDNDNYINVYKYTHDYIMYKMKNDFYDVAYTYSHIPPEEGPLTRSSMTGNTFRKITCDKTNKDLYGVVCGDNNSYRQAFELYFNTLIGNKYMINHLSKLYGSDTSIRPISATLESSSTDSHDTQWIQVRYENESYWEYLTDNEVDCSEVGLTRLKSKLIGEGKSSSDAESIINQIKPYCKVKVVIVDEDGNILVSEKGIEKCIKGTGCRSKKFSFAICDVEKQINKEIEVKVKYHRSESSYSVKKLVSCANANVNQILYAFFKKNGDGYDVTTTSDEEEKNIIEKTFSITNYKCNGSCDEYEPIINDAKCENNEENYNGVYKPSSKDPSLRCIVNLNNSSVKTRYDYSDYFGVNTNFCRVYCSDEIEYVISDKVRSFSGRNFVYDIGEKANSLGKSDYKLSSVVKQNRSCVSEIYYNKFDNVENFKNIYGLSESEYNNLKSNKTFTNLFNILKNKASVENSRIENLNQIIYDIYNCNFFSKKDIAKAGVEIPKNYKETSIDKIKSIYNKDKDYGLGTDINGDKVLSYKNSNVLKYGFGPLVKNTSNRVQDVNNNSVIIGNISSIYYCKNSNGFLCYSYDLNNKDLVYNYPNNKSSGYTKYTLFANNTIDVPSNDYARLEIKTEIDFYNNNSYQADYGSGKIVIGNLDDKLMTLDKYVYPVDKDAYNMSICSQEVGKYYHRCPVTQVISPIKFYRNNSLQELKVKSDNAFSCYVDVKRSVPDCEQTSDKCEYNSAVLYRNVDPQSIFPSGNVASNWKTTEGLEAIEYIQSTAEKYPLDDTYLDYSITLSPNQIKNIKNYNKNNSNYKDDVIYNCKIDSKNNIYYDCKSAFLDIVRGDNIQFNIGTYGNINKK